MSFYTNCTETKNHINSLEFDWYTLMFLLFSPKQLSSSYGFTVSLSFTTVNPTLASVSMLAEDNVKLHAWQTSDLRIVKYF